MSEIPINIAFEDMLSESVIEKLLVHSGRPFVIGTRFAGGGFGQLKSNARAFNYAARAMPYFLLTDLDNADCAPTLIHSWLSVECHHNLVFRVACREVEAWLLADRESISSFLGVGGRYVPRDVDSLFDPKAELIQLAKRCRIKTVRDDIVPRAKSSAKQGPNYNDRMIEFVRQYWCIDRAVRSSDSLHRASSCISRFDPLWPNS